MRLTGFASARAVAVARIGVAAAVLLEAPGSATTLVRLTEPGVIAAPYAGWMPPVATGLAGALILSWVGSGLAFLIGWRARWSGPLLTATLAAVLFLDQQLYSNHLYLMVLLTGLLTIADAGAVYSLDARRRPREQVAAWPVWLLRAQVSIVYGFAALAKLNVTFLSGSVVASYLRREGPFAIPADWRSPEPMLVLSVLAICLEAFLAVGLWVPRWRPAAFVGGLSLHIGISGWLAPAWPLFVFSLLMLPLYVLFLGVDRQRVVVWDDSCSFCAGWVRWFRRLDWLRALRFVPRSQLAASGLPVSAADALAALQLVTPRGAQLSGFRAVAHVAELLPISCLWAPVLRLPPIRWAGDLVYRRVAVRRTCAVPHPPDAEPVAT